MIVVEIATFIKNKTIYDGSLEHSDGTTPPPTSTELVTLTKLISSPVSNTQLDINTSEEELIKGKTIFAGSLSYARIPKKSTQVPSTGSSLISSCLPVREQSPDDASAKMYCAKCGSSYWGNQSRVHTPKVMFTHSTHQCRNWRDDGSSKWYTKKNLPPMDVDDDWSTSSELTEAVSEAGQEWFREIDAVHNL